MNARHLLLAIALLCSGCGPQRLDSLPGTLEWDRIALPAEASEPVLRWLVAEGDQVAAGDLLLELDPRRQQARVAQAQAEVEQASARWRVAGGLGPRLAWCLAARGRRPWPRG